MKVAYCVTAWAVSPDRPMTVWQPIMDHDNGHYGAAMCTRNMSLQQVSDALSPRDWIVCLSADSEDLQCIFEHFPPTQGKASFDSIVQVTS